MITRWASMLCLGAVTALAAAAPLKGQTEKGADDQARTMSSTELAKWIDQRFAALWSKSGITPPPLVDDATFMRRLYLDLVGTIPSVSQLRDFWDAGGSFKRPDLVDQLLRDDSRPERFASRSAEHLARIWRRSMIPRSSPNAAMAPQFDPWLREQFAVNLPYDELARALVTAQPPAQPPGPAPAAAGPAAGSPQVFYQAIGGTPVTMTNEVARYFLGVRLNCAQCHPHPFQDWSQQDFWGLAAFFGNSAAGQAPTITDEAGTSYRASFLWGGEVAVPSESSPREVLADWLVSPKNPNFAATAVNRIWQHLCGRGVIASVDELDEGTDEERKVLDELGGLFAEAGYDVRWLIEGICKSDYYRRVSLTGADESPQLRPLKTLTPEQVFDSLEQALSLPIGRIDNPPRYNGLRNTFVARMDETASESPADFRDGIPQALMIMNGKLTADATDLRKSRTLRAVVDAPFLNPEQKIEALYLAALTRAPTADELQFMLKHVRSRAEPRQQREAYAEIFWGLINSPEFVLSR